MKNFLRKLRLWWRPVRVVIAPDFRIENQFSISEWATSTFGTPGSNFSVAARANQEMAELLRALAQDDQNPKAASEIADVVIILYRLAERLEVDLHYEVDKKMQINRRRKWQVGHGHGQHVEGT